MLCFTTTIKYGMIHNYFLFHHLSYRRSVGAGEAVRVVDGVNVSTTDSVSSTVLDISLNTEKNVYLPVRPT